MLYRILLKGKLLLKGKPKIMNIVLSRSHFKLIFLPFHVLIVPFLQFYIMLVERIGIRSQTGHYTRHGWMHAEHREIQQTSVSTLAEC